MSYRIDIVDNLDTIPANVWNNWVEDKHPFLQHLFLTGLEQYGCLGSHVGWHPHHLVAYDVQGNAVGAIPTYLKENSFGEFVFDWSWASVYQQHGLDYYPKLVSAIPFTPVTGSRLLSNSENRADICLALQKAMQDCVATKNYSSAHILFPPTEQISQFEQQQMLRRLSFQYHWKNHEYESFEHYLSFFKAKKRKNVKRERRLANHPDINIDIRHGNELSDTEWLQVFECYQATFYKKANYPSLTLAFFKHLANHMSQQLVIMTAKKQQKVIAASICFKSETTLYGRYWGCKQEHDLLHFELCFYRGIEYCIEHGLQSFEPGAQGEHKITRGFLPQATWSAHWINIPVFEKAIRDFINKERLYYEREVYSQLQSLSPFRQDCPNGYY